jgi:uncharacterized protein YjiS (DUF1127 family)
MTQFVTAMVAILDLGSVFDPIISSYKSLRDKIITDRATAIAIKELNKLTDRELADIGISRSMIRSVAMEAYK